MYRFYIVALFCLISAIATAQITKGTISGKLTDSTGKQPLALATVAIFHAKDTSLITYRLSDPKGVFKVPNLPLNDSLRLIITHTGSAIYKNTFLLSGNQPDLDFATIKLEPDAHLMEEVLVVAERPPVIVRKDTIEFNAEAFKTLPSALVEDLLRKLPGVDIDAQGNITVNGRKVNKLYVDGKEFFGSDPQMATKNLPANIIDKIQVTDDKEQMRENPDIPLGQVGQVINLKLKKAIKKGWFGKAYAGAGTDKRYETGGIFNLFRDTLQISLLGYTNNINKSGFGIGDVMNTGGFNRTGINSMAVYGDGGFALNNVSFGGTGSGIQRSTGAGFNMNNQVGKKLTLNFQYFYGQINSDVNQLSNRQQFFGDTTMTTRNLSAEQNGSFTHRIGGFAKWRIDSTSNVEFRPSLTLNRLNAQKNMQYNTLDNYNGMLNKSNNLQSDKNNGLEFSQFIQYNKNFRKKGRTFFASANFKLSDNNNNRENNAENIFLENQQETSSLLNQLRKRELNNQSLYIFANYNEPLSKSLSLRINEALSAFNNKDNINTFNADNTDKNYTIPDTALTNGFTRSGIKNNTTLSLKYTYKKVSVSPGISYQFLNINNHFRKNPSIPQKFNYLLPSLQINIGSWNISYSVNVNEPSVNTLQPVADNSNPLYIQKGNPSLKPSLNHNLYVNTYKYDMKRNINYNVYFSGNISNNAIVYARTVDKSGVQVTTPLNADGIWSAQTNLNFNKQINFNKDWKFSAGANMWATYGQGLVIVNDYKSTIKNWNLNPRVNITFNWKDVFEFRPNYGISWNKSSYTGNIFPGLEVVSHNAGSEVIVRAPKHWVWETSIDYRYNPQVAPGIQKNMTRWNAGVNFLFLKDDKGQLKLSVYDLLNQNTSVRRTVNENYIEDYEITILKRYFMLTFTYNIRSFGGKVGGRERLFLF